MGASSLEERRSGEASVDALAVHVYRVPTEEPESDATLAWEATTAIVVEAYAGDRTGLGYTYGDPAVGVLVESVLAPAVRGRDALAPAASAAAMAEAIRNAGRPGAGAMAISAVDLALWDLRARLLSVALADSLPLRRTECEIYGSGGFTSLDFERLGAQLAGWAESGMGRVKMKIGRDPVVDPDRLDVARDAIGPKTDLMVDANGAYGVRAALEWSERLAERGVRWFEEPVSSEDRAGLRRVRDGSPAAIEVAAGEYGWELADFAALLDAGSVDVLQADVTRCGGITPLLQLDGLCRARQVPLSAHCAPAASLHPCCALETFRHLEYFHDHVRVESLLFDGVPDPRRGALAIDRDRAGNGLELRRADAAEFEL